VHDPENPTAWHLFQPLRVFTKNTAMLTIRYKKQPLLDALEAAVTSWPEVEAVEHERGGREFRYRGKEIGHVHFNGDLDILFNRKIRDELLAAGRVETHRWVPESGWTTFVLRSEADIPAALNLLRESLELKKGRMS
jgi:hypothetical protein